MGGTGGRSGAVIHTDGSRGGRRSGDEVWYYLAVFLVEEKGTPDGCYLVGGGLDGTVRIWDLSEGKEVVVAVVYMDGAWVWINRNGYFNASDNGLKYVNVRRGSKVTTGEENLDLRNPEKAGIDVGWIV